MRKQLSHFNASGQASMVHVGGQHLHAPHRHRFGLRRLPAAVVGARRSTPNQIVELARFAGIQAAKRTAELIPMCHPLALTHVDVETKFVSGGVRTGVRIVATAVWE